jgi:hypothetical protein
MGRSDDIILDEIQTIVAEHQCADDPCAFVMVAALFVGPSIPRVTEITGVPAEVVKEIADRLRASGLWAGENVDYSDWFADGDRGKINFAFDVLVAQGSAFRSTEKRNGQYVFKPLQGQGPAYLN